MTSLRKPGRLSSRVKRLLLLTGALAAVLLTILPRILADHADLATRITRQSSIADRRSAINEMQALPPAERQKLLPELKAILSSSNPRVRQNAAEALGELDQLALPALDDLKRLREDGDPQVRRTAAISLARMGQPDDPLIADLTRELTSKPPDTNLAKETEAKLVRFQAANALGFIASGTNSVDISSSVAALIQTVTSDPDPDVRSRAAWALGSMGARAQSALPALITVSTTSDNANVRSLASWAIDRIRR